MYTITFLFLHGGCDPSAEDAYSTTAPIRTFALVRGLYWPTFDFVIAFWIMIAFYTLLTLLFCMQRSSASFQ
jgi:hypothetical protein